jgi:iron complex outermembrane recepter protein
VKYQPEGFNALLTAAVFDLTRKNLTVPVVLPSGVIERQVVGESRSRGFEIEGKAQLNDNLNPIAGYSYLDTEVVEGGSATGVTGNAFASVPNNMASLWGYYTIPGAGARGDISLGLGARYTGSYYFNQQNSTGKSDPATLLDAAFGYQVTQAAQLTVNVSNLLDEQHVVGRGTADYYNPGRTIMAGLNYSW